MFFLYIYKHLTKGISQGQGWGSLLKDVIIVKQEIGGRSSV